jgi:acetoacetyl-CoA synthetase
MLGSTGSPLSAGGFTWAYNSVKSDLWLMAFSGGTDVATALVGGNPNLPVIAGEMQCRWLGAAVEAWDTSGSATDSIGELVITRPMPSMPLMLVGDPDGERYRDSYFEKYSHVWQHGDLLELTSSGGAIIHGRSDSTLNRRGIRIGTGEIYNSLSKVSYLKDSLALEVRTSRDSEMVLFVVLHEGHQLDDEKARSIRLHLRDTLTPRHLPDRIVQVSDIPRTLNGKKMEVPTKRLFGGAPAGEVFSFGAMSNPECVEEYVALARGWLTNGSL